MATRLLLATALLAGSTLADDELLRIRADAKTTYMYDTLGRVRVFHGVNAVHKGAPWYPQWMQDEALVKELASWGVNSIRLGWMWSGYQPKRGADGFNETYFEESSKIVKLFAKHGIHTFLDMHQDCFSSLYCMYDGFPMWVAERAKQGKHAYPFPYQNATCSSRSWGTNCLTEAVGMGFQSVYDNYDGMRDDMVEFWRQSAKKWAGNPNILAYELVNEPFAGDIYHNPLLLLPGNAGQHNLQPLYHEIAKAIREIDNTTCIMYEPVTWGMLFDGKVVGSGFTEVPGGPEYADRSILSYHYYCRSFGDKREICKHLVTPDVFRAIYKDLGHLGGSGFLTEFGYCDTTENVDKCVDTMDQADKYFASWTEYDHFGQTGVFPAEKDVLVKALTRPFPRAIAGEPVSMSYDSRGTQEFKFCYDATEKFVGADAPVTEVFVPFASVYPRGEASVELTEGKEFATVAFDVEKQTVSVTALAAGRVCMKATV